LFVFLFLHEWTDWGCYVLNDSLLVENVKRKSYFLKGSLVVLRTLSHSLYTNSGYGHGHLLPASDTKWLVVSVDSIEQISGLNFFIFYQIVWKTTWRKLLI